MRKGGGKQKGASWERELCVLLSRWVSNNKQDDVFWRAAMSGGRATVAFKRGGQLNAQAGDISCVHPMGHKFASLFYVEAKHYADLNYVGLLTGKGHLIEFWDETRKQAKQYGKRPLLIAKQNRILPMVCLTYGGAEILKLEKRSLLIAPARNLRIIPLHEFLQSAARPL